MNAAHVLDDSRAARIPTEGLAALAPLRRLNGVRVAEAVDCSWIVWDGELPSLVRALLPVTGVQFFTRHAGYWRPTGAALPDFAVPIAAEAISLDRVIVPLPVTPLLPPETPLLRMKVGLAPSHRSRPTSALRCRADTLIDWAATATTWEINQLRGAVCGENVWLLGSILPRLTGSERFWGERVLIPLGLRAEPDWPEGPLRIAANVDDDEILVLTRDGPQALPVSAFQSLSRAAIRRLTLSLLNSARS